jgi:hypothetical protein
MMIDQLIVIRNMLKDDAIRPSIRARLEEERRALKEDVKKLYIDLFKILSN